MQFFLKTKTKANPFMNKEGDLSGRNNHVIVCNNDSVLGSLKTWWSLRRTLKTLSLGSRILRQSPFVASQLEGYKGRRVTLLLDGVLTAKQLEWVCEQLKASSHLWSLSVTFRGAFTAQEGYEYGRVLSESWPFDISVNASWDVGVHLVKELGLPLVGEGRWQACVEGSDEDFAVFLRMMSHLQLRYLTYFRLYLFQELVKLESDRDGALRQMGKAYLTGLKEQWSECQVVAQALSETQLGGHSLVFLKAGIEKWDRKFQEVYKESLALVSDVGGDWLESMYELFLEPTYLALFFMGIEWKEWHGVKDYQRQRLLKEARNKHARRLHPDKASVKDMGRNRFVDKREERNTIMTLVNVVNAHLLENKPLDPWAIQQLREYKPPFSWYFRSKVPRGETMGWADSGL